MAMKPLAENSRGSCPFRKTANTFAAVSSTAIGTSSPQHLAFLGRFFFSKLNSSQHHQVNDFRVLFGGGFSSKATEALRVKVGAFVLETPEANEQNIEVLSVSIYPSFDHVYKMDDLALINVILPHFCNV